MIADISAAVSSPPGRKAREAELAARLGQRLSRGGDVLMPVRESTPWPWRRTRASCTRRCQCGSRPTPTRTSSTLSHSLNQTRSGGHCLACSRSLARHRGHVVQ
eukprot:scaffold280676_cov27-Tisochrysis_lutea.AAC.5